ncbi:hypothetical protein C4Q28_16780 [Pseudomonas sp. SWI6]|uniref:hypothetical protein n=1 Tax=unclassified Pseudomonas TaxID=196821 RepID=UPI000CE5F4EC|nr:MULTISPECIES: hypothetical protein [unclassified Pseudomonas]AVD83709.1 hypothetical protein C4Q28_16780 [Pseudomonas sp. SWI6]AVD85860.1 hypothetical protein C4Q26_01230 [Pseudomonas sp. SWI44]WEZ90546.1 hypothetical protein P3R38_09855 [Pseudomonas sp. NyZ480]
MLGALLQRTRQDLSPWQRITRALWGGSLPLTRAQGRLLAQLMLLPSAMYLLLALAYLAQITDLIGSLAPHAVLQRLADHGQWLGAFALALLALSCLLRKGLRLNWGFGRTLLWALLTCTSCLYLGNQAQRLLIDSLVERTSPSQQAQAAFGMPLLNRMLEHDLRIDGQTATPAQLQSPEGKWRLAELALLLPDSPQVALTDGLTPQAFFEQLADQRRGGLERNYQRYLQATGRQEDHYRQYRRASQFYADATSRLAILQRQGQAWTDYLRLLTKRGRTLNPWNLPLAEWQPVRHVLREQMNVPVNDLWRPDDRRGFNQAVARQVRREARNRYAETLQQRIDAGWIEPGLTRTGFLAVNAIQAQWRQDLALPAGITLYAYLTKEAFALTVYRPALQYDARELMKQRVEASNDLSTLGRDSYRDLVTPGVTVLLISIGLVVHLFRTLAYLLRLGLPQPPGVYLKLLALYVLLLGSMALFTGKSQVPAFGLTTGNSDSLVLTLARNTLDWTAAHQAHLYAWGNGLRQGMLRGYGFGATTPQED